MSCLILEGVTPRNCAASFVVRNVLMAEYIVELFIYHNLSKGSAGWRSDHTTPLAPEKFLTDSPNFFHSVEFLCRVAEIRAATHIKNRIGVTMTLKKTIAGGMTAAFALGLTLSAFAQDGTSGNTNTPRIDQRQTKQQTRIDKGAESGRLTPEEQQQLQNRQARIARKRSRRPSRRSRDQKGTRPPYKPAKSCQPQHRLPESRPPAGFDARTHHPRQAQGIKHLHFREKVAAGRFRRRLFSFAES